MNYGSFLWTVPRQVFRVKETLLKRKIYNKWSRYSIFNQIYSNRNMIGINTLYSIFY